ncbi:[acyl-carrier-protein] S-malonyltransferase [Bacteroidetes/Chlorobi group bacterium Naka2016]|jgi:[acyl-carrier-protein] S-malonyltransferase|nr:MAG: [acyl-carrier-protein] S-malonyltransferase [Bacteroidetes/Chlorobi group bacterium Naka2016]
MKTALLAPGQGSQYVGMIRDLYEEFPVVRKLVEEADKILNYKLSEICFNGPLDELKKTRYTQPALFLHSACIFELIKNEIDFHCTAGHSVGEYAALYFAGVLTFEDSLRLVQLRGDLMFRAGEFAPGTMFAVIGAEDRAVEEVCEQLTKDGNGNVVVPANYNCPGQLVVSGSAEYLRANVEAFKKIGAKIVKELVVSGAFHSPLMEPAREELGKAIENTKFEKAKVPVYLNVSGKPETDAQTIKNALIQQLTSPVKWTQSVLNMYSDGVRKFIEVGAGNVLQGLVKRTVTDSEIMGLDKAEDVKKFVQSLK